MTSLQGAALGAMTGGTGAGGEPGSSLPMTSLRGAAAGAMTGAAGAGGEPGFNS